MSEIQTQVLGDFQEILNDIGEYVILNRSTKTVGNVTGKQTLSYGSNERIKAVFQYNTSENIKDKEGQMDLGDALMYCFLTNNIQINDKVTRDGIEFRVYDTHPRFQIEQVNLQKWDE